MKVKVEVFTSGRCPYCGWAKRLLEKKGVEYEEIRVDTDAKENERMRSRTDRTSVPQIFIDDMHVGGYQEMVELDQKDKLDELLRI